MTPSLPITGLTQTTIGLASVNNTAESNKFVSIDAASALSLKADKATAYTKTEMDTALALKTALASVTQASLSRQMR